MDHHDDITARRSTRLFVLAAAAVLAVLATSSTLASPPPSPLALAQSLLGWTLGSAVGLFLAAALVYASVGCAVNLRRGPASLVRR